MLSFLVSIVIKQESNGPSAVTEQVQVYVASLKGSMSSEDFRRFTELLRAFKQRSKEDAIRAMTTLLTALRILFEMYGQHYLKGFRGILPAVGR